MTFYLKPPRGNIHMERILDLCRLRCTYLELLNNHDQANDFCQFVSQNYEYLEEAVSQHTTKDRISHFMTRLSVCSDYDLSQAFLSVETKLFELRFTFLSNEEKLVALLEVERHLKERNFHSISDLDESLARSIRHIVDFKMLTHPCLDESSLEFEACCCRLKVPFQLVPYLVSNRQVILSKGLALISCQQVSSYLSSIFRKILQDDLQESKNFLANQRYGQEEDDTRLEDILNRIQHCFKTTVSSFDSHEHADAPFLKLTSDMVEKKQDHFPPWKLHRSLVSHRRLHHYSRIAYTLFLKEIGLSRDESVKFWSTFYAKPSVNCACSHTWQADEKKFMYSIDHLFGRTGSRKNYSAHGCNSIVRRCSSPNEQLTCPFVVSDDQELMVTLEGYLERNFAEKVMLSKADPLKACSMLIFYKTGFEAKRISKPSKFFNLSVLNSSISS